LRPNGYPVGSRRWYLLGRKFALEPRYLLLQQCDTVGFGIMSLIPCPIGRGMIHQDIPSILSQPQIGCRLSV
jgi:hypothetical protein